MTDEEIEKLIDRKVAEAKRDIFLRIGAAFAPDDKPKILSMKELLAEIDRRYSASHPAS